RLVGRGRGKKRAVAAVGRSILVIAWPLLSDPEAHFHDLGVGFYDTRIGPERATGNHIRQLEALGYKVTLEPTPALPEQPAPHPDRIRPRPGYCRVPAHRGFSDQDEVPGSSPARPTPPSSMIPKSAPPEAASSERRSGRLL